MWFSKCVPWHFAYKNWKLMSTQKPAHNVYSSFIHIFQNLEATRMSFSRWIDKLWYIQMMEYPVIKRDELSSHEKTLRKLTCILLNKRSQSDKAIWFQLYNILGKIQLWRQWKYQWLSGVQGEEEMTRWSTGDFSG